MKIDLVKGFVDIEESSKEIELRRIIEDTFKLYNFIPVETPIIEYEEFVCGENTSDEAVSDIFKLQDKGGRKLALRYEFTFQLKRLAKNKKLPYKRYQIGPVFRDEPITGNRWRQFTQCDVDIIGSTINEEAEIMKISSEILNKLGIKFQINFNNRKLLNEILKDIGIKDKYKNQVIKEIDKLDKQPIEIIKNNLKKYNAEKLISIFNKQEKYFEKYPAYKEIKELKNFCLNYKVNLNFQPFLARGLSYYNGSIFEIKSITNKGIKESLAAGGSYLINNIQSTGISFGLNRIILVANINRPYNKILIISLNQDKKAILLAEKLRNSGIITQIYYNRPGKALEFANSLNIPLVIFIGKEESKKRKLKLKNMNTGKERLIGEKDLYKELKKLGMLL